MNKFFKSLMALLLWVCCMCNLNAQSIQTSGHLMTSDGIGITGASISTNRTSQFIVSDLDGIFDLNATNYQFVVMNSSMGFSTEKISAGDITHTEIVLLITSDNKTKKKI